MRNLKTIEDRVRAVLEKDRDTRDDDIADEEQVTANLPTIDEQIAQITEAEDEKSSAFSVSQEDIDSVLQKGSGVAEGKYRIYRQFQKHEDSRSNIAFLKQEYGTGGGSHTYPDGTDGNEWHDGKGIAIEKQGSYTNPDLRLSWAKVEKRLRELINAGRYLNPKERDHYADYLEKVNAPQYEVETQRKIARQGFINAHRDLPPADKRDTLSLRLSDFIRDLDGYEKDLLSNVERSDLTDVTAEQMERHLSDPATVQQLIDFLALVQGKTGDVYSRSNAWRFGQELMELHPLRYLYHEGDVVYIGADKYEISAFDENAVSLQNVEFPLFGKEYSRADFEEKLKENPANDHLKVIVTESQKAEKLSEEKPDSIALSIGFSEHPAFYDMELNDRFTELPFALGNRLLGVLDEKQHREREDESKNVGWYHKTDFTIKAVIDGEEFNYEGRFDIGDGEGDLIAHIRNFYDYSLSPDCPFIPEWKRQGEDYYREQMETLRWGRDVFIPFLERHTELTKEDESLLAEIMATEADWDRNIHKALKYAVKIELIEANPADKVERPKKNRFVGSFYDSDEVEKLFEAAKGTRLEIPIFLGAFYGLRRSEALGLKWDAIDFQNDTITIRHTVTSCNIDGKHIQVAQDTTKTKSSMRTLPLVPVFKEKLLALKEQQEEYRRVCGKCYDKRYLEYICVDEMGTLISPHYLTSTFPKLLEKNGLRHIRFHDLRHSCASLLLANGVPMKQIQEWLGHSDFSTTANVYAHLDYNSKLSSADAMVNGLKGALATLS